MPQLLSPRATTTEARALEPASHNCWARMPQLLKPMCLEPMLHNRRSHCKEKATHSNKGWPPLAATREGPRAATKTQHSQNNGKNYIFAMWEAENAESIKSLPGVKWLLMFAHVTPTYCVRTLEQRMKGVRWPFSRKAESPVRDGWVSTPLHVTLDTTMTSVHRCYRNAQERHLTLPRGRRVWAEA